MDGYREFLSDYDAAESEPAPAPAPARPDPEIGSDERRMHVRAYNYWVSLLGGRDFPSIEDLEPADLSDFSAHSVLLDFTCGRDNPATPYIGSAIRAECGLEDGIKSIEEVPSRSLLSRLTDHYMQIIANRAPVGFEAEFVNQRGLPICYRGILMPFSSDGDTIDFIYGVINWKQAEESAPAVIVAALPPATDALAGLDDDLLAIAGIETSALPLPAEDDRDDQPAIEIDPDAGLADRLWAARETAETVKSADHRSRSALYRALALAYDFALAAQAEPDDYAELLEESGMKAQARAPMTPIVKLVFGIDYDKTRLTEFASALSHAQRLSVESGGFLPLIEGFAGGLKGVVAAEREARRPQPKTDTAGDIARQRLRDANALELDSLGTEQEFHLVVTRRRSDGSHEPVALVIDEALLERAIRKAAG
jgi:hypothetical protein